MRWVALAIGLYVLAYTLINFGFRKTDPAHEPWAEAQERTTHRTVTASLHGWSRFTASVEPASAASAPARDAFAEVQTAPTPKRLDRALPPELVALIPRRPSLHAGTPAIVAPASVHSGAALQLELGYGETASQPAFGEAMAYTKDHQLFIFVQDDDALIPGAAAVPPASSIAVRLPAGALAAGAWNAALYTREITFTWAFTVQ